MWWVQIEGDEFDLNRIIEIFSNEKSEFQIITRGADDSKFFYLEFELETDDPDKVLTRAKEIITQVNGAIKLKFDRVSPIEIHQSRYVRDVTNKISTSGTTHIILNLEGVHVMDRYQETVKDSDGNIVEVSADDSIKKHVLAGLNNPKIQKVLDLTSKLDEWVNLYRIYEIILDDVGGTDHIIELDWTTKNKINRFKHTANHPNILGKKARHGVLNTEPPKHPMDLSEAQTMFRKVIDSWIKSKTN